MGRRNHNKPDKIFENVSIIDIAEEGRGVGKTDELVLFVEKAVPGDVADVLVYRSKKNFGEGRIIKLQKPSEHRVQAFCEHFGTCGGCKWQHMTYAAQLQFKQKSVADALSRLAKIDVEGMLPIVPSPEDRYYRNKLEFTFSNKRWLNDGENRTDEPIADMDALGFHIPGRFDKILDVRHCYLQADPSNAIRTSINEFAKREGYSYYDLKQHAGALRNLIIRTASTGELMVIVVFAYAEQDEIDRLMAFVDQTFPQITSLLYIVNQKKNDTIFDQDVIAYKGPEYIHEAMPARRTEDNAQAGGPARRTEDNAQAGGPARRTEDNAQAGGPARRTEDNAQAGGPARRTEDNAQAGGPARRTEDNAQAGGPARRTEDNAQAGGPARRSQGSGANEGGNDIKFRIGPKSFYQTNSSQAQKLYEIARDFAGFTGNELVYDLYTGAGTIANFIAGSVREVVGIEYVPSAIEDAKINSAINNITNTKFYAGDMKDVLVPDFIAQHGKPDVIITDPPRAGMHPDVVERLMEIEAPKIVYVSCNAATQARDLLVLKEKYDTVKIQPVDMFPHTQHVENVVLLVFRD